MTTSLMRVYDRFDVIAVPFPFTDRAATKKRPALVLSSASKFNSQVDHVICAMITDARHDPWALDVPVSDLEASGLKKPSIVRFKLFTLDIRLIIGKIGRIEKKDQERINKNLKKALF